MYRVTACEDSRRQGSQDGPWETFRPAGPSNFPAGRMVEKKRSFAKAQTSRGHTNYNSRPRRPTIEKPLLKPQIPRAISPPCPGTYQHLCSFLVTITVKISNQTIPSGYDTASQTLTLALPLPLIPRTDHHRSVSPPRNITVKFGAYESANMGNVRRTSMESRLPQDWG